MNKNKNWIHKGKLNNQGFTLIELIIAIIILGIVVTPFLHAFMTSTKLNVKSRTNSQATVIAQNVLEGLKTETYVMDGLGNYTNQTIPHLESVMYQFTYPQVGAGSPRFSNFYILPKDTLDSTTEVGTLESVPSITSTDMGVTYQFQENASYVYQMYLLNVKQQGQAFDILVTLDGRDYTETAVAGQTYNATDLVQIPNIDTNYDAVCTKNYDTEAIAEFTTKAAAYGEAFQEGKIERVITVDVLTEASDKVRVTAQYFYKYKRTNGSYLEYSGQEATIFYGDKSNFRNVYLYFYPMYTSTTSNVKDKIVVNNNNNSEAAYGRNPYSFNLFLIKQENNVRYTRNEIKSLERYYRCYVTVMDTNHSNEVNPVVIRTNIGTNLYSVYDTTSGTNYKISNQALYYHNTTCYSETDAYSKFQINVVTNKGKKTAYMNSIVSVYEHQDSATGTLGYFQSQTPIVELEGSFIN